MLAFIALLNQLRYGQRDDSSAALQSVVNPGPPSSKLNILHPLHATRKNWWNFDFFLFTSPTWNVDLLYGQVNFPPPPNLFVLQPTFSIWAQTHPTQRNGTFCNCIWFVASSLSFSVPPADSLQISPATLFDPLALKAAQTWSARSNLTGKGKAAFWSEKREGCSSLSCQQSFQLCSEWCACVPLPSLSATCCSEIWHHRATATGRVGSPFLFWQRFNPACSKAKGK